MKVIVQVTDIEYVPFVGETIEEVKQSLPTELCLERNISVGALVDYIQDRTFDEEIGESDGLWELEDAIACGIADETGYLVDSYSYEITEVEGEKLEL